MTENSRRPSVLFACRANAGRSVTARLLTEHYAGAVLDAHSAGSEPGDHVHPEVTAALAGLGLDTSGETPKPFDPAATYTSVITMGCGESCPFYAGASYEDWPIADPKNQDLQTILAIVADIDAHVRTLIGKLVPDRPLPPSVVTGSHAAQQPSD